MDQYGNQARRYTDEYGNPIQHQAGYGGGGMYGNTTSYPSDMMGMGMGGTVGQQLQPHRMQQQSFETDEYGNHIHQHQEHGEGGGMYGNTTNNPSDMMGMGMGGKVGQQHLSQSMQQQTGHQAAGGYGAAGEYDKYGEPANWQRRRPEKKGMMDKIKEKLHCSHQYICTINSTYVYL